MGFNSGFKGLMLQSGTEMDNQSNTQDTTYTSQIHVSAVTKFPSSSSGCKQNYKKEITYTNFMGEKLI